MIGEIPTRKGQRHAQRRQVNILCEVFTNMTQFGIAVKSDIVKHCGIEFIIDKSSAFSNSSLLNKVLDQPSHGRRPRVGITHKVS
jgi:predicted nucleotide-binding protein (sugar kinase/HSP70/actin superfamily)